MDVILRLSEMLFLGRSSIMSLYALLRL